MREQQPHRSCKSGTAGNNRRPQYNPQITSAEFCDGLMAVGFTHRARIEHLQSGESIRIPAIGKGPSNRSASVKLSDDGTALLWYDWPSGTHGTLFSNKPPVTDPAEIAKRQREDKERTKKREAETARQHQRIAQLASQMWADAYASGDHPYISTKQLTGLHNARLDAVTGELLIPVWVSGIGLVNLQRIDRDGNKRFLKGGRIKGGYSVIGSLDNAERVFVATGWATGSTLYEKHGLPVVVAFSDGNLMEVCQALRSRFSDITIVIAGDDDRQNEYNSGRAKAIEAAEAVGAGLYFPDLCKCCLCTDHNDVSACAERCARG